MSPALFLPLLLIALLIAEAIVVRSFRRRIRIRIHVSGTRGKSTVVRYIAAGLRAGGSRPLGKVTGVLPELILPDGTTERIRRRGAARVHEQVRTIVRAGRLGCDALVLECMSVEPSLQKFEAGLLRPTISVLTNARKDHEEVYAGLSVVEGIAAAAIAADDAVLVMPGSVAGEIGDGLPVGRPCKIVEDLPGDIPRDNIQGTQWENISLALQACVEAGVPRNVALAGILTEAAQTAPMPHAWESDGVQRAFIDAFSVNDTTSAEVFIGSQRTSGSLIGDLYLILNTRSDRPLRSRSFAQWVASRIDLTGVIITGSHSGYCRRALIGAGVKASIIHHWSRDDVTQAPESCERMSDRPATFIGIMNIAGDGFRIVEAFGAHMTGKGIAHGH